MSFTSFNLDPRVAAGVLACKYETPTPIQKHSIPPAIEGRDILGLAQTGTGKTAAFALPILHRLLDGPRGTLRALIMAPTRELAEQIRAAFDQLSRQTKLKTATIYGGVAIGPQQRALRNGVDIVVACPGRLLDHMRQRSINLSRVEILVLDEADMMLDMGFLPDVRRIIEGLPNERQNLLFSATMPAAIRDLSGDILRNPATFHVPHSKPIETVAHALYPVHQQQKTHMLLHLLRQTETGSVLIFTRTKHRAKRVATQLTAEGFNATSLQGNLSQNARQAALGGFRRGTFDILVATDIAARGIDIADVSHVINYDMPDTTDAYTHRIGRTGRATRTGDAFTLSAPEDEPTVRAIERILGSPIERRSTTDANLPAVSGGTPSPRGEGRNNRARNGSGPKSRDDRGDRKPRFGKSEKRSSSDAPRRDARPARGRRNGSSDSDNTFTPSTYRSAGPKRKPASNGDSFAPRPRKFDDASRRTEQPARGGRRNFDDRFEQADRRARNGNDRPTNGANVDPLSSGFIRSARLVEDVVAPNRPGRSNRFDRFMRPDGPPAPGRGPSRKSSPSGPRAGSGFPRGVRKSAPKGR
ncbi:RNA helicase [candidate division BRC1 bacterium HGW-BRC1-1]|nr:MAG: RNA helicase [candidate division BRC1 bacterium HGW-BRC1-1]